MNRIANLELLQPVGPDLLQARAALYVRCHVLGSLALAIFRGPTTSVDIRHLQNG